MCARLVQRLLHALHDLAERRVATQIAAQDYEIREWTNEVGNFRLRAAWLAGADDDLILTSVAVQEHLERREQRRKLVFTETTHDRSVKRESFTRSGVGMNCRSRAVFRELQRRKLSPQLPSPVKPQWLEIRFREILLTFGVAGVLDRKLRQRRGAPFKPSLVNL